MGAPERVIGGRFEILERVGKGSFGEVLRARDHATGGLVAIKRLFDADASAELRERFHREARYLACITSPHVVRFVAEGMDRQGKPCIALEWLPGTDLAHVQRRGPLPVEIAVEIARRAALGLHALHEQGIVHRDVKPANFFVVGDAARLAELGSFPVKLIDLGIARASGERALTERGSRLGTPVYMSPEQARGEEDVTAASDLFSLGIVLYELASGRRPFTGDRTLIVLAKIVLHDPPPLDVARPDVPAELSALVARALAKRPAERFGSALEMARALEGVAIELARRASGPPPSWAEVRADPSRPASGIAPVPQAATPARPASELLSGRGEQRVITAVFADLSAAADRTAGRLALELAAAELGGVCHGTLGHQVIVVFGSAASAGDEALRGARLALSVRARVPGVRIVVATSRARVGETGLSADVIERGSGLRPPGAGEAIVLDAPTARLVGAQLAVEEIDQGFLLCGEIGADVPAHPRLLGRATPTVGRDGELAMLEAMFTSCVAERAARLGLVTGPAGVGKSRLRWELSTRLAGRAEAPTILLGRGESLRAGSPYAMIADLVRRAAGIVEGEPPEAQRRKIEARIAPLVSPVDVRRLVDFLGELGQVPAAPGVASAALRAARSDPALMGDATRMAFEDWIAAECARAPVVILLEDLHWGDLPTVKLVTSVVAAARVMPLYVLALARPEVHALFPSLAKEERVTGIRLEALRPEACERLARAVLGAGADPAVVRLVAERAGGNAFYLEEMIRAAAEGKEGLPDSVLGLVQARLDALGRASKRVLRAASIFGERFSPAGVRALCGGDAALVSDALDELVEREVLIRCPDPAQASRDDLAFRHALVREAAYAMLSPEDLGRGHKLAAEWLGASGETDAALVATHFERGGEPELAIRWWLRAAEQALVGNDFDAAIERAERGARCAEGEMLGSLRLVQAEASRWSGDAERGSSWARKAVSLLPRGSSAYFRAIGEIVSSAGRRGAWDEVERWLDEALALEASREARSAQIACVCPGATLLLQAGRTERAARVSERAQALASGVRDLEPYAVGRIGQLRAFRALHEGDLAGARRGYVRSMALFESAGHVRQACVERINLGHVCAELGDFDRAEEVLSTCLAAAQRMRLGTVEAACHLNLARVLAERGRLEEASIAATRAEEQGRAHGGYRIAGAAEVHRSGIAYRRGDFVEAEALSRKAEATLLNVPPLCAGAMASRARALVALGRVEEALLESRRANAIVESGKRETLDKLVRLVHAEVLWAAGAKEEARAAIEKAKAEILGSATRIGEPELRRSFLEKVEVHARTMALASAWGA
ncbi:serine/threonine-protein kinase [Polyangium sp. 6x1]|uniref:serine/threonine-protein kinase n=1 Tax=Polyangium sp. 6x1 TaxID=3042689 RepID=UPI00248245D4|nr:serine/threonine-protein kinase [Polyangium sp. 6x1]MDI1447069.1 protein kinase [Polyangium sp. 6x1]